MTTATDPHDTAGPDLAWTAWLPRLSVAATFIFHGIDKFGNLSAGAEMMGLPLFLWTLVALGELGAGLALIAGGAMASRIGDLLTRAGGAIIAIIMAGAISMVHWGQWRFAATESHPMGGMEFQVLLLALGLMFLTRGNRA